MTRDRGGTRGGRSGGRRQLKVRVRSAKGRKLSSTRWLQRQLNDPYVSAAKDAGLRSRAAFKLIELDDKYGFLRPGMRVIDLGAAPGGWSQVAAGRVKAGDGKGRVVAVDLLEMDDIAGVHFLHLDFMDQDAPERLSGVLEGLPADAVLSDMAAPATGHRQTDHLQIMGLCELALDFALSCLSPGGIFLAKVLRGGTEGQLLQQMKRHFATVRHVKPAASRADSAELYVLATDFQGAEKK